MLSPQAQDNLHKFLAEILRSPKYAEKLREHKAATESAKEEQELSVKESA